MEKVKKKINLQRLSSILSEKEMKNVLGGSSGCSIRMTCSSGTEISCHGRNCSYSPGAYVRCDGTATRCSS